ncbi:MAG: hypothetical protein ACM3YF_07220, partial [Candidatus Zixiibacteriota bacterium]
GNDVAIDTCSPNNEFYGVVVIPDDIGNPGDSIHPRGAVMYHQAGFTDNIGNDNLGGGDSLAQRYSWNLDVSTSTRRRQYDTLTGVWRDTLTGIPLSVCNADPNNGAPYRNDEGFLAIAKKRYSFPTNPYLQGAVARYGMGGLISSIDTLTIPGIPGIHKEVFTVIHISSNNGFPELLANAQKGIGWYINHAGIQVGDTSLLRNRFRITLEPDNASTQIGNSHTVTATLMKGSFPVSGHPVTIQVFSGPNSGKEITDYTDPNGQVQMTYTGTNSGTDMIYAGTVLFPPEVPSLTFVYSDTVRNSWTVPPDFIRLDPPTLPCGATYPVTAGTRFTDTIVASNANPAKLVKIAALNLPAGAVLDSNPNPAPGNPDTVIFRWIPTDSDEGLHTVTFVARNSDGSNETQCPIAINVRPRPDCSQGAASLATLTSNDGSYMRFNNELLSNQNDECLYHQRVERSGLKFPKQIIETPNHDILVASFGNDSIYKFSSASSFIQAFTGPQLDGPWGLAMPPNDSSVFFVTSYKLGRVLKFNLNGTYLGTISSDVPNYPSGIAFSEQTGYMYIAGGTGSSGQIAEFRPSGGSYAYYRSLFIAANSLKGPHIGLAVKPGADLYAASEGTNMILQFSGLTGDMIRTYSDASLVKPQGIGFSKAGELFVASSGNNRILRFGLPGFYLVASCDANGLLKTPTNVTIVSTDKGDLDNNRNLTPADVVLELNCVFLGETPPGLGSNCYCDLNCELGPTPADIVLQLQAVYLGTPFPC